MIDIFFYFCLYSEARHYFHENFAPYDWSIFLKKALRLLPCGAVLIWSKAKQGQESLSTQSSVQKMWKLGKATNIGASQHLRELKFMLMNKPSQSNVHVVVHVQSIEYVQNPRQAAWSWRTQVQVYAATSISRFDRINHDGWERKSRDEHVWYDSKPRKNGFISLRSDQNTRADGRARPPSPLNLRVQSGT